MAEQGLNNAALSKKTNIPYHRLDPWFRRHNAKPNAGDLEAVAKALEVPVQYLLTGETREIPSEREWMINLYDKMPPEKREQLRSFARFLASEQAENQSNAQKPQESRAKDDPDPV